MDKTNDISDIEESENLSSTAIAGVKPSNLKFNTDVKKYSWKRDKVAEVLKNTPICVETLKRLALSEGGLVDDSLRKDAWPLLLNLTDTSIPNWATEEEITSHREYDQVVLDVNRSLKRFPPGIPLEKRLSLQYALTRLILRILVANPELHYYQGYHDIAVTFLLVTEEYAAFRLLQYLSENHLKGLMDKTMENTTKNLSNIFPLIRLQNEQVFKHLRAAQIDPAFAVSWYITWFGHNLNQYEDVTRLYDYFLVSHPYAPIYLSAVIVVYRSKDILEIPCDMGLIFGFLQHILDDIPLENLLEKTTKLFEKYPPAAIEEETKKLLEEDAKQLKWEKEQYRKRMLQKSTLVRRLINRIQFLRHLPFVALYIPRTTNTIFLASAIAIGVAAFYMRSQDR